MLREANRTSSPESSPCASFLPANALNTQRRFLSSTQCRDEGVFGPEEDLGSKTVKQRRNRLLGKLSEAALVINKSPEYGSMIGGLLWEGQEMVLAVEEELKQDKDLKQDEDILTVIDELRETVKDLEYKHEL